MYPEIFRLNTNMAVTVYCIIVLWEVIYYILQHKYQNLE